MRKITPSAVQQLFVLTHTYIVSIVWPFLKSFQAQDEFIELWFFIEEIWTVTGWQCLSTVNSHFSVKKIYIHILVNSQLPTYIIWKCNYDSQLLHVLKYALKMLCNTVIKSRMRWKHIIIGVTTTPHPPPHFFAKIDVIRYII